MEGGSSDEGVCCGDQGVLQGGPGWPNVSRITGDPACQHPDGTAFLLLSLTPVTPPPLYCHQEGVCGNNVVKTMCKCSSILQGKTQPNLVV